MAAFTATLKIYPVTMQLAHPKTDMECGGKVVLPVSALHALTSRVSFLQKSPMLFMISFGLKNTHCGVLEFTAEEGNVNVPSWILGTLQANIGDTVQISSVYLTKASYARFEPQSTDFLDMSDPTAVLENHLRGFACLTEGDVIPIFYNNRSYLLKVEETKPARAVCINECDMEVDFSQPVGYVEPAKENKLKEEIVHGGPIAFSGQGFRLDGKKSKQPQVIKRVVPVPQVGQPNFDYKVGTIEFFRNENNDGNNTDGSKKEPPQSSRSLN
uniref:Ubiquitin fusion degradation protein 1 n=1 Tax=Lygus hesperus TaxID=30085 RepID=A0A0A9ZBT3_LYGHE